MDGVRSVRIRWFGTEARQLVSTEEGTWREATSVEIYLRELLSGLVEVEDEPCRFDHHGYCQEHGWTGEPGVCCTRLAREAVGLDD